MVVLIRNGQSSDKIKRVSFIGGGGEEKKNLQSLSKIDQQSQTVKKIDKCLANLYSKILRENVFVVLQKS